MLVGWLESEGGRDDGTPRRELYLDEERRKRKKDNFLECKRVEEGKGFGYARERKLNLKILLGLQGRERGRVAGVEEEEEVETSWEGWVGEERDRIPSLEGG